MAITFTPGPLPPTRGSNGLRSTSGTFTVTSYTAAGEPIANASYLADKTVYAVEFHNPRTSAGYTPSYDGTKLRAHKSATAAGGSAAVTDLLPDVLGGVAASHLTDQASAGANVDALMAATAGDDATLTGAGITLGLSDPDYPRNLNIGVSSVGGATAIAGNVIVTGVFSDGSTSETIAIPTGAVAAGKFRNKVGTKVCISVSNVALDTAQPADILVSVGLGTKMGLSQPLDTPAAGDVEAVQKNNAKANYSVDTVNNAVTFTADLADDDDLAIEFVADLEGTAGLIATEASAADNIGTVTASVTWD